MGWVPVITYYFNYCVTGYEVVQSLNSPFFPPHTGAEPRVGEKRVQFESSITCMRMLRTNQSKISEEVNFYNYHRHKIEVPDPLAVKDLISSKLNNKRKLARLITQADYTV